MADEKRKLRREFEAEVEGLRRKQNADVTTLREKQKEQVREKREWISTFDSFSFLQCIINLYMASFNRMCH